MSCYLVMKNSEVLIHATIWTNFKNIMIRFHLYKLCRIGKSTDRKYISACLRLGNMEQNTVTCNNVDEYHRHYAVWKELDSKEFHDSILLHS